MAIEETWQSDDEVSGSIELKRDILGDSVSFTRFLKPRKVELRTEESQTKRTIEDISVDLVYNMRQSNGMDSIGWEGAGFLRGKLQYTGFTRYDQENGMIYANQYDFLGKKIRNEKQLKAAIRAYYGENIRGFRQALNSLPEDIKDLVKKVLI